MRIFIVRFYPMIFFSKVRLKIFFFFVIFFFLFFKFFIVESQQTKYFYPSTIVGDRFLITKCPSFYSTVILMNITRYQFFLYRNQVIFVII